MKKKILIIPILICLLLSISVVYMVSVGAETIEYWRIIFASIGFIVFLSFLIFYVRRIKKLSN
ncbi:hypothetical protein D0T66_16170 [Dysgonomonas sp. 25]|nr:hypothetical protein [Dysgonomonas sp. 25]